MLAIDKLNREDIVRIFSQVVRVDDCWEWTGYKIPAGYGRMRYHGKEVLLHRLLFAWAVAPIPDGRDADFLQLDHLCRNRAYCNPAHLELVTCAENIRRGIRRYGPRGPNSHYGPRKHIPKTHCPHGHPYDGDNVVMRPSGTRVCRECHRRVARESARKKRLR